MRCLNPVLVGYSFGRLSSGKLKFVSLKDYKTKGLDPFHCIGGHAVNEVYAPCGKCPLCEKSRKRDIVTRIVHESRCHDYCWFVTLTYAPEYYLDKSLSKRDVQLFLKRFRKRFGKCRYVLAGEYGARYGRKHYHLILFGPNLQHLTFWEHRGSYDVFRSKEIEECWPYGFSTVTKFDYRAARYIAAYVRKKVDPNIPRDVAKPFFLGSRGRGEGAYGAPWFDRFHTEMLRDGFAVLEVNGSYFKVPLPRYYLRRARERYPAEWYALICRREEYAEEFAEKLRTKDEADKILAELASAASAYEAQETKRERRYEK